MCARNVGAGQLGFDGGTAAGTKGAGDGAVIGAVAGSDGAGGIPGAGSAQNIMPTATHGFKPVGGERGSGENEGHSPTVGPQAKVPTTGFGDAVGSIAHGELATSNRGDGVATIIIECVAHPTIGVGCHAPQITEKLCDEGEQRHGNHEQQTHGGDHGGDRKPGFQHGTGHPR